MRAAAATSPIATQAAALSISEISTRKPASAKLTVQIRTRARTCVVIGLGVCASPLDDLGHFHELTFLYGLELVIYRPHALWVQGVADQ